MELYFTEEKSTYSVSPLRNFILKQLHKSPMGGHSRYQKTLKWVRADFFWHGLRTFARNYIRECDICQQMKSENIAPTELLQPLPISEMNWTDNIMDSIEGLPRSQGYDIAMVVVDRLSKYAHFPPLSYPYTAASVTEIPSLNFMACHSLLSVTEIRSSQAFSGENCLSCNALN